MPTLNPQYLNNGYRRFTKPNSGGGKYEHQLKAEQALGRPLPKGVEIHHVDGNKLNNSPRNLVICQDHSYHALLHLRQDALDACGNANWRKCKICKQYDDPSRLQITGGKNGIKNVVHSACNKEKMRLWRADKQQRGAA